LSNINQNVKRKAQVASDIWMKVNACRPTCSFRSRYNTNTEFFLLLNSYLCITSIRTVLWNGKHTNNVCVFSPAPPSGPRVDTQEGENVTLLLVFLNRGSNPNTQWGDRALSLG